ncbi:MAG TPA: hypothetical protein VK195_10095 [Burkholderiaceae bacterium]|nr:hypothetical protein [Burkholderiaceae bacterium]
MSTPPHSRRSARGQAMVEMLVLAAIALALVFVPWDGKEGSDSVVMLMLKAIKTAYAKFLGAISLPI